MMKDNLSNSIKDLFVENKLYINVPKNYEYFKYILVTFYKFNGNNEKYLKEIYNYYCQLCNNFNYKNINGFNKWRIYTLFAPFIKSVVCLSKPEYWQYRGYNEKEIQDKIKENNAKYSTSLDATIKKYGEEEGTRRFNERYKKSAAKFKERYANGEIDFSNRKTRSRKTHKESTKPKYEDSLRFLFLDENYVYSNIPKPFEYFSNFLITYYKFSNNNEEYLRILYNEYINLCIDFKYINIKNFILTRLFPNYIKKCSIFKILHWLMRGYTIDEAKDIVSNILKNNALTLVRAIEKYGEAEGKIKYNEYCKNISNTLKDGYASGKLTYREPYSVKINPKTGKRYTEEERKEQNRANALKGSYKVGQLIKEGKVLTAWQKDFWINKGFSEEEAELKIYDMMAHSNYEYFINKYGEEVGKEKYEKRIKKYKETINNKTPEEKMEWNYKRAALPHKTSKAATLFFEKIIQILLELIPDKIDINCIKYNLNEYYLYDNDNLQIYFYDYTDLKNKIIIEFNGIKFHPKYWEMSDDELKNWKSLGYHVDGITLMKKDIRKEELAHLNNFNFATVWEDKTFNENLFIIKKIYNIYDEAE